MQTIKINLNNITNEQVDLIAGYLKRGQVIAYPTDTIYGLGCDARDAEAVERIKKIKERKNGRTEERKNGKAMIVLVSDYKMLKRYCVVSGEQEEYLRIIWPKINPPNPPLQGGRSVTVILESKGNLPKELTGGLDSLAVRLPKSEFLIKIIKKCGFPIVSTSLNKTGQPPLENVRNLEKHFEFLPNLAVDGGALAGTKPSRLIDLRDVKNAKVIRE